MRPSSQLLELANVVSAADAHFIADASAKIAEAALIEQPKLAIFLHHPLVDAETDRTARSVDVHFGVIEVRVSRVEEPIALATNGDAGVTQGVTNERDEQYLRTDARQLPDTVEPVPWLSVSNSVRSPGMSGASPLLRPVTHSVEHRRLCFRGSDLVSEEMHRGTRKIIEPARMVEVEVRKDDLPDVARIEPKGLDLPNSGQALPEFRTIERAKERAESTPRIAHIVQAIARIDQDE